MDELSKKLKISTMTVSRSMTQLSMIGVVSQKISGKTGRKKIFQSVNKKEYYECGKVMLINPIKKTLYVKAIPDTLPVYKAGLTALAEQTMLGESEHMIYATAQNSMAFHNDIVTKDQALSEGLLEVQIMRYDIGLLTQNLYIDPISMIMTLEEKDDRIEIAIEELMEEFLWYEA